MIYDLDVPNDEIVKTRQESGTAYVDFHTGKYNIVKNFRNNAKELEKIEKTIAAVRKDKDIMIKSISIVGYASPEGTQSLNEQLSAQRTRSLADYIRLHTQLPSSIPINASAGGEDWALLRSEVEKSHLSSKNGILEIIDNTRLSQDEKEREIQETYPADYKWLLENVYPKLRRSVYVIEYTVRNYTDLNEISRISQSNPQKLSLWEMYRLAKTYRVSSPDFYRIILLASGMFPNSAIANLNAGAANIEMRNYAAALRHLKISGNSQASYYNRGVYYALNGEYDEAIRYFKLAPSISASSECIRKVEQLEGKQTGNSYARTSDQYSNQNTEKVSMQPSEKQEPEMPEYLFKSNLDLQIGYSRTFGEFAGLLFATPSLAKDQDAKFFVQGGIGREFIFDTKYKKKINWFIGVGLKIGNSVYKRGSHSGGWFYSTDFNYGKSSRYKYNVISWNLANVGYIYDRFTFSAGVGGSTVPTKKEEKKESGFEWKITISYRLF